MGEPAVVLGEPEAEAALQTLAAFVRQHVQPLAGRPEEPAGDEQMAALQAGARDAGLVADDGEGSGLGLWEALDEPLGTWISLRALATLAETAAGVAFDLHLRALGAALARRLALPPAVLLLGAGQGIGRGALARLLAGSAPRPGDVELLAGAYPGFEASSVRLQASGTWDAVVLPLFDPEGHALRWVRYAREDVAAQVAGTQHGLDETRTWTLHLPGLAAAETSRPAPPAARDTLIVALGAQALGLMAIAAGATRGGLARARRYAGERTQGGRLIREHAAVQLLLAGAGAALETVTALLDVRRPVPTAPAALAGVLSLRAVVHPLLCRAASDALQVLGGYGYMRDFGLEKALRDNQQLKLMGGTPTELKLFLAAGEDAP